MAIKRSTVFLILFRSWIINKNVKKSGFCKCVKIKSRSKQNLDLAQDLSKIKKNPEHPFTDIGK